MVVKIGDRDVTIPDEERTETEVYTRVMGYYRRTIDMNIGKRQEHRDRKFFKIPI